MHKNIPVYLTVKDIQIILRCGRDKAYKIVNRDDFPKLVLYGTILIHPEAFIKWMRKNYNAVIS